MEQLINLLLKFIVSNKTICKDIKETISEISSEDISEDNLLAYYNTIPSEEKSLVYACLAKILNLKEYLLSKEIETIAKSWDEINVGNISFNVPYVLGSDGVKDYKDSKFSGKLGKCLKSILGKDPSEVELSYSATAELIKELINAKVSTETIELAKYQYRIINQEAGKCNCQVFSQIVKHIYDKWEELYDSKTDDFATLFTFSWKEGKKTTSDIGKFFQAFNIGVDCSGYVTQVYAQWMLKHGKSVDEMIDNIGASSDKKFCRTNCYVIREEKYSTRHIGYFFLNTYQNDINKKLVEKGKLEKDILLDENKNYKRDGERNYSSDGNFNSKTAEKEVKSNLKAGDLICFEHNHTGGYAHYAIVEKTGINEQGQWYFCVTESTIVDKDSRTKKLTNDTKEWNGVRHNQGYYTSIKDFIKTRKSIYEFFWFCRPKAIAEYYNSNNIIEYKEEES